MLQDGINVGIIWVKYRYYERDERFFLCQSKRELEILLNSKGGLSHEEVTFNCFIGWGDFLTGVLISSVILRHRAPGAVFFFIHNVIYFAQLTPVCFVPIFSHS